MAERQISAFISERTKELVEGYVRAHGVKKGHLIEEALLHHLQALRELPADVIIPPRIVVTEESWRAILEQIEHPPPPTKTMRDLFREPRKTRRRRRRRA